MKRVKDVIEELNEILKNFGNLPVAVTEEAEEGKPLTPLASVVVLETGLSNAEHQWINDEYDSVCVLSTSRPKDVLGRITAKL